jgi:hypothetical protein
MYDSTGTKGEETDCPKRLKTANVKIAHCLYFYELVRI